MPVIVSGKTYFGTIEAYRTIGVGRSTLFRWLKEGHNEEYRDWRGWRIIPEKQVKK